jgi:hypothetical protein
MADARGFSFMFGVFATAMLVSGVCFLALRHQNRAVPVGV